MRVRAAIGLHNINSALFGRGGTEMAANNYFQEYLVFRTRDLDADRVPRRCVVCEVNPSLFAYEKRMDSRSVRKESGYCCTSCAFNMLVKLANEETRSLAALTRTSARRRNGDRILSEM